MKLTVNIDPTVLRRLREEAARRGTTMSKLAEAGVRRILGEDSETPRSHQALPPLPGWHSNGARVDVANRRGLHDQMED